MYRMNNFAEILLAIILVFILIGEPHFLETFADSVLGKLIFVSLIIITSLHSVLAGILMFVIFITLRNDINLREGMENNNDNDNDNDSETAVKGDADIDQEEDADSDAEADVNTDSDSDEETENDAPTPMTDSPITLESICKKHGYTKGSGNEQMAVDEALRPADSNSIPVKKQ